MRKNQRLAANVITPTTKSEEHDEPVSPADIVARGLMSQADWDTASQAALALFAFGQAEAARRGLLLVDTKYELGKDADGNIVLLDEVSPRRRLVCDPSVHVTPGFLQYMHDSVSPAWTLAKWAEVLGHCHATTAGLYAGQNNS